MTLNTANEFKKQAVDFTGIQNLPEGRDDDSDFSDKRVDKLTKVLEFVSPNENDSIAKISGLPFNIGNRSGIRSRREYGENKN